MNFLRSITLVAACSLLAACASSKTEAEPKPKKEKVKSSRASHGPGLLNRLWASKGEKKPAEGEAAPPAREEVAREVGNKRLMLSMSLEPQPLQLSEARQVKVTLHVANRSKKLAQLEFPTTQRIEVLIRDSVGKLVEQWSEDRSFANEPGMVSINPGERLEYTASLSTRDMVGGETYVVEALFPQYEPLRIQRMLTPVK